MVEEQLKKSQMEMVIDLNKEFAADEGCIYQQQYLDFKEKKCIDQN